MSIAKKMSRVLPLLVFLSIQLIFVKNTLGAAVKSNIFKATSIQGNHRNADCNVTYTHHGKDCEDCDLSAENPAPITFKLGEGDKDFVRNSLCGGWQESGWSIQGVFQNQKTDFLEQSSTTKPAYISSVAEAPKGGGEATSTTTFKGAGLTADATVGVIGKKVKKDDAQVGGEGSVYAYGTGEITVKTDGATIVEVSTNLWTRGGVALIVAGEGLTLPVNGGTSGGFTSRVTHTQDPTQDFYWEVTVVDGVLSGLGASNPGWTLTDAGWFLPESSFPFGDDITFTLVEDAPFEIEGESMAYDEKPCPIPTLTEWVLIVLAVSVGGFFVWQLKRRRKAAVSVQ
jgi:hypothetical protein